MRPELQTGYREILRRVGSVIVVTGIIVDEAELFLVLAFFFFLLILRSETFAFT